MIWVDLGRISRIERRQDAADGVPTFGVWQQLGVDVGLRHFLTYLADQLPVVAPIGGYAQNRVATGGGDGAATQGFEPLRFYAIGQVIDFFFEPAPQQCNAAIGAAQMLTGMAGHGPQATPGVPIARRVLPLCIGRLVALAVEVGLAQADIVRPALVVRIITVIEVPPRDDCGVGVVDRCDPAREARTAEVTDVADILKNSAILRKIGHQMVVHTDPDEVAHPSRIGVEKAMWRLVVLNDWQGCKHFAELRA